MVLDARLQVPVELPLPGPHRVSWFRVDRGRVRLWEWEWEETCSSIIMHEHPRQDHEKSGISYPKMYLSLVNISLLSTGNSFDRNQVIISHFLIKHYYMETTR